MSIVLLAALAVLLTGASAGIDNAGFHVILLAGIPLVAILIWTITRLRRFHNDYHQLKNAMDGLSKAILITDSQRTGYPVVSLNLAFTRLTRYDSKSIVGGTSRLLEGPDTTVEAKKVIEAALKTGCPCRTQVRLYRKDGKSFWSNLTISPVRDETGHLALSVWELADVTASQKTVQTLRVTEARHQALIQNLPDSVLVLNHLGTIEFFNPAGERLFGYAGNEVVGQNVKVLLVPSSRHRSDSVPPLRFDAEQTTSGPARQPVVGRRKDGTTVPLELTIHEFTIGDERKFLWLFKDLTGQRTIEQQAAVAAATSALAESATAAEGGQKVLRALCETLRWDLGALWQPDENAQELRCQEIWLSPGSTLPESRRPALGQTCRPGEGLPGRAWQHGRAESSYGDEGGEGAGSPVRHNGNKTSGLAYPVSAKGDIIAVLEFRSSAFLRSDTATLALLGTIASQLGHMLASSRHEQQIEQLEAQLRQSQKGEIITNLAGGIAHDLNNTLSAILGFTELVFPTVPSASRARTHLKQIIHAGDRAKDLVQQILTFTRRSEDARAPIQLDAVVTEALKLVRPTLPATVELQESLLTPSATVMGDPVQLNQVLINLCANAEHAMRQSGGVLEIRLEDTLVTPDLAKDHPALRPGRYARLVVRDTGHGMPAKVKKRIFEPFFTTKPPEEAAGLGLSVAKGIIAAHDGAILVDSSPQGGTTVAVYVPLAEQPDTEEPRPDNLLPGGSERILYVEDEAPLAELGREMLQSLGYNVLVRTDPLEALQAFRTVPERFDLVITNQTMPHMTGEALSREILRVRPGLPIILLTGFSHSMNAEKAQALGIKAYLQKPVVLKGLALQIRQIFDRTDADAGAGVAGAEDGAQPLESLTQRT